MRRFTWMLLSQNAQVIGVERDLLTVGFKNAGARESFVGGGSEEILRQARSTWSAPTGRSRRSSTRPRSRAGRRRRG